MPIDGLGYETEPGVVPIESLAPDQAVPIESLAPDQPVPIESLAPDQSVEPEAAPGIEASFRTFDLLIRQGGQATPSLAGLMGQAARPLARSEEPEPVAIGSLVYRGQAALERAVTVRHQIAAELSRQASLDSLQPLLQELLDLVPLALEKS